MMSRVLRLFFTAFALMAFSTYSDPAFSQGNESFSYRIKVSGVTDAASFKDLCVELDPIFDSHAQFNDATDEITIVSAYHVPNERLAMKLTALGYSLTSYNQVADLNNQPK
jgi:hypothetical protein